MNHLCVLACLLAPVAAGPFTLSNVFASHMVLQRNTDFVVWGFGNATDTVHTTFLGNTYSTSVGPDGIWRQALRSTEAGGPYNISGFSTGSAPGNYSIADVLFGDVYFCAGQSNMQFTVDQGFNATAEVAAAADSRYQTVRVMSVGQHKASGTPLPELNSIEQAWTPVSPSAIGGGNWTAFSAVCWFFGRDVFDSLGGSVPIGLISSNWGGTQIQAWLPPQGNAECPANITDDNAPPAPVPASLAPGLGADPNQPSNLWNSMVYPFTVGPLALTGFTWYQGESNVGKSNNSAALYACQMPALINTYRAAFNSTASAPWWGYVILHPWVQEEADMGTFRDGQMVACTNLSNVACVPAIDIGDPLSPFGSIHPRHKQVVGQRLSAAALTMLYGQSLQYRAPQYAGAFATTTGTTINVTVTFAPGTLGGGLQLVDGPTCPYAPNVTADMCAWYSIKASDGNWYNATAGISSDNQTLFLTAAVPTAGLTALATSYGYNMWPVTTLYSTSGLPAFTWQKNVTVATVATQDFAGIEAVQQAVAASAQPLLGLTMTGNGGYSISVSGQTWFSSPGVSLFLGNQVYASQAGGLTACGQSNSTGSDGIGSFTQVVRCWQTVGAPSSTTMQTSFVLYDSGNVLGLKVAFPQGTASQVNPSNNATGFLASTFPAFSSVAPTSLGVLAQNRGTDNCGWTVGGSASFPITSAGLMVISPIVPTSAPASGRVSVGFAALTQHMSVEQVVLPGGVLATGPRAQYNLPAGWEASFVMVAVSGTGTGPSPHADLGMTLGGPNDALYTLGDALLSYHGKSRPAMNFDRIHSTLGVGTTAFYFRNPCDCGQWPNNTCPPDDGSNPYRLGNCNTFQDTFMAVDAGMKAAGIPYGHMLIDSWWYGETIYNGVSQWEDGLEFMSTVQSFPQGGLKNFTNEIGNGVAMWAHNGKWVNTTPYMSQYPFAPGTTMPQGRELWDHLFSANSAAWNLRTIKQDHVAEQIAAAQPIRDPGQVPSWLSGMGDAALDNGVGIQYCCSTPDVLINSVTVPAASGARSSPDYLSAGVKRGEHLTVYQWANGVDAGWHYSIGLVPDKDTFMSNNTEVPHGGDGLPNSQNWPPFYNWTEGNAVKHALMATMSGGPIHVSDRVGSTNATLVWALMRGDGTILRPSRPQTGIDGELRAMMAGAWVNNTDSPADASAVSLGFASPLPNQGRGEVYFTVSLIPAATGAQASGKIAGPCLRWTTVTAMEVSLPYNMTAGDIGLDQATLAASTCTANDSGRWVTYNWDLSIFGPSSDPQWAVRPVFDGSAAGSMIPVVESNSAGYNAMPQVTLLAPVTGGWVILGEQGKMVPVSPQRITAVVPGTSGGVTVSLNGAPGEVVTISACPVNSAGSCSSPVAPFKCSLPASGTAALALPAGTCA